MQLQAPWFEDAKEMLIAGLRGHFNMLNWSAIPAQWQRLAGYRGLPGQVGYVHYGLCFDRPHGIDYLSGVQVTTAEGLGAELSQARIPAQKYAVFAHREHVSRLYDTVDAISRAWLPGSGYEVMRPLEGAPNFFERYGEKFDPLSGMGEIEVWMPIKRSER